MGPGGEYNAYGGYGGYNLDEDIPEYELTYETYLWGHWYTRFPDVPSQAPRRDYPIYKTRAVWKPVQKEGNVYDTKTIEFNFYQPSAPIAEGIGAFHSSYKVTGTINFSNTGKGTVASITAVGYTGASNFGKVTFKGTARLVVDKVPGKERSLLLPESYIYQTGTFPIGSASFLLPQEAISVGIKIDVSYSYTGEGNVYAAPSPGTMIRTIDIPIISRPFYFVPR